MFIEKIITESKAFIKAKWCINIFIFSVFHKRINIKNMG